MGCDWSGECQRDLGIWSWILSCYICRQAWSKWPSLYICVVQYLILHQFITASHGGGKTSYRTWSSKKKWDIRRSKAWVRTTKIEQIKWDNIIYLSDIGWTDWWLSLICVTYISVDKIVCQDFLCAFSSQFFKLLKNSEKKACATIFGQSVSQRKKIIKSFHPTIIQEFVTSSKYFHHQQPIKNPTLNLRIVFVPNYSFQRADYCKTVVTKVNFISKQCSI